MNTCLLVIVIGRGIRQLIISGIRTEQCCETTARHASDLGWQVLFVPEATMTWNMRPDDGEPFAAQDIRRRTAAVLHRRFATVAGVDEALRDAHAH